MKSHLSKSDESLCENLGLFGVLISSTCLLQNFVIMTDHWFNLILIAVYALSIWSYVLLMKKKHLSVTLLWISGILVLTAELIVMQALFSLVLVLLLCYLSITIYLLYGSNLYKILELKKNAEKDEEANWQGRI